MNTVSVDKSLLTRVTQYVADRVFDFQQAETAPDGSIEVEAQEIIDSELKLLSELQAALAQPEQPTEQPEAGRDGNFSFAYIAGMLDSYAACIHEYAPADDFARWHYVPEIQDAATWLRALRPQPQEANAEAVELLRELAKDFEALAKKEELDPSRTAEEVDENWRETMLNLRAGIPAKFLAQHGGRGDE